MLSNLAPEDEPAVREKGPQLGADVVGEPADCPMEQAGSPVGCVGGVPLLHGLRELVDRMSCPALRATSWLCCGPW